MAIMDAILYNAVELADGRYALEDGSRRKGEKVGRSPHAFAHPKNLANKRCPRRGGTRQKNLGDFSDRRIM
jgi:hypothetical protein